MINITESVLEMHFHHSILTLFNEKIGLGKGGFNFYKYSTQKECFIGFDQAFVFTEMSDEDLFDELRNSAINNGYNLSNFFVGLFLQFKVVNPLKNRTRLTPYDIKSKPYYKVALDTKKNVNTGFSQHELLFQLSKNDGALVYYACPMVFNKLELYLPNPDLSKLRLVDVASCPSSFSDNESHSIYFDNPNSIPIWKSEPIEGNAISLDNLVNLISNNIGNRQFYDNQLRLFDKLQSPIEGNKKEKLLNLVGDFLLIIQFKEQETLT